MLTIHTNQDTLYIKLGGRVTLSLREKILKQINMQHSLLRTFWWQMGLSVQHSLIAKHMNKKTVDFHDVTFIVYPRY